jgi:hypothetical protein
LTVLRRISGPKREEIPRGWRTLHNEGLHNFYSSLNIIRMGAWGDIERIQRLGWKTRRKRLSGRPGCRWKDLKDIGREDVHWIDWLEIWTSVTLL